MDKKYFILFLIFISFSSCVIENSQVIHNDFQEYVDMFFIEGNKRGLNLELEDVDITMRYGDLDESLAGICQFMNNTVTIDQTKWEQSSEEIKTWLIFHELGHCILDRSHSNIKSDRCECLSIMRGVEDGFDCSFNLNSSQWWKYYLDELFDEEAEFPFWNSSLEDYNFPSVTSEILKIDTIAEELNLDEVDLSLYPNYSVDFQFNILNTSETFVKLYLGNIGFSHCDICSGINTKISSDVSSTRFYHNLGCDMQFESNIKMTVKKIEGNLYFYVNEQFVHTFESSIMIESTLSTIRFDEPLHMNLAIHKIE